MNHISNVEVHLKTRSGNVNIGFYRYIFVLKSCNLPLSCSFRGGTAHGSAYYGGGSGTIWMDDVQCTGEECSLAQCRFYGWGHEDCSHSEDVAVKCSPANGMYYSVIG